VGDSIGKDGKGWAAGEGVGEAKAGIEVERRMEGPGGARESGQKGQRGGAIVALGRRGAALTRRVRHGPVDRYEEAGKDMEVGLAARTWP
jgi:hypothetical protein